MNEVTKGEDWQVVVTFCLRFLYGSADKLCRHRQPICYHCFFVFPWLPIVAYLLIRPGKFAGRMRYENQPERKIGCVPTLWSYTRPVWVRAKSSTFSRSVQDGKKLT